MLKRRFFSAVDIADSIESLEHDRGAGHPVIYWIFLLLILGSIVALPVVKVDISVGARGQIRPAVERLAIFPAASGPLVQLSVADNQTVKKGEVLAVIDTAMIDARLAEAENQLAENQRAIDDLVIILGTEKLVARDLSSADRMAALQERAFMVELPQRLTSGPMIRQHGLLTSELGRLSLRRAKATLDLERVRILFDKQLLSKIEYAQNLYNVEVVEREFDFVVGQTLNRWQADLFDRQQRQVTWNSEAKQLREQKKLHTIVAPIDGTALGFSGLQQGLFIPMGQRIGEISPAGGLQADVFLSPRDVGFVRAGQAVTVQVDAFPYTEWGTVPGRVRHVSHDFVLIDQQSAFKVIVDLGHPILTSGRGTKVELRRGMTVNARFVLQERTLFNVLYGRMSDFLDPLSGAP